MKRILRFAFGKFDPITTGHQKIIDRLTDLQRFDGTEVLRWVCLSSTAAHQTPSELRLRAVCEAVADYAIDVMTEYPSPFQVIEWAVENGINEIHFVVGSDRMEEFDKKISRFFAKRPNLEVRWKLIEVSREAGEVSATTLRNTLDERFFARGVTEKTRQEILYALKNNLQSV